MKKGCELCPGTARMYCESDQASLCFDCDARVHGANFLVARHSRVLLCRACQSPTPWRAAGARLGPTLSLCERCLPSAAGGVKTADEDEGESRERVEERDEDEENVDGDDFDDEDDGEMEEEEDREEEEEGEDSGEEEEGEEQVVPWTMEPAPPPASSSSSEEETAVGRSLKRSWQNADLPPSSSCSQDQLPCSSSSSYLTGAGAHRSLIRRTIDEEVSPRSFRPLKDRKRADLIRSRSHQLSADHFYFGSNRPPI